MQFLHRGRGGRRTKFCYFRQLQSLSLVNDLAIIALARNVYAEDDGLVHHLIKMNSCAYILRNLWLGVDEKIPGYMHQLDQSTEILFDGGMVRDDQGGAFLRRDPLPRVVE